MEKTKKQKRIWILLIIPAVLVAGVLMIALFRTGRNESNSQIKAVRSWSDAEKSNVLIAYFTGGENMPSDEMDAITSASVKLWNGETTGDAGVVAMRLQELTHGDLYSIQTKGLYSSNYDYSTMQAWFEQRIHHRPGLAGEKLDISRYDVIIIGYPQWWMEAPMAIESFLKQYDFDGKTILPYSTNYSSGLGESVERIRTLAPGANVADGLSVGQGRVEDESLTAELLKWLDGYADILTEEATAASAQMSEETDMKDDTTGGLTAGKTLQRSFINDNVLHSQGNGDIHFASYIPESYDGSVPYALFITLPGWEGLYFQGVGENLKWEDFGITALGYNSEMIVLAPQLNDWGETSADQTIALTEYFLSHYNIDPSKVYLEGYSGGGETGSIVMGKRPELYTAYLMVSSQWDGALETLVASETPVYMAIGEADSYYGSEPLRNTYRQIHELYEEKGLSEEEIGRLLVLDLKDQAYFSARGVSDQHAGGGTFAHDEEIMGWLFGEH